MMKIRCHKSLADPNKVCYTTSGCYKVYQYNQHGVLSSIGMDCFSDNLHYSLTCSSKSHPNTRILCCTSDLCNYNLTAESKISVNTTEEPLFISPGLIVSAVVGPITFLLLLFVCFLIWRHFSKSKKKLPSEIYDYPIDKVKSLCSPQSFYSAPMKTSLTMSGISSTAPMISSNGETVKTGLTTTDNLGRMDSSFTSGSGSGAPFLVQRTVSRQITLLECIGKGRFGQVWRGCYQGENVAVKIFSTRDEASWIRETEIYHTVLLRHDNILGYYASDMISKSGCTQLWLITHYQPHGSLYDFLSRNVVDSGTAMRMAKGAAAGLCHLHTEIFGLQGKPAIVHRDIKSRNILVTKSLSCCIADLGLAVIQSSDTKQMSYGVSNQKVGTRRYMAPEILDDRYSFVKESLEECGNVESNILTFEVLKAADVYAFGLVLWEILRRCQICDDVDEACLPFWDLVPDDPSHEEMKEVVCDRQCRPPVSKRWLNDPLLSPICRLVQECWHDHSASRVTMLRIKKSLLEAYRQSHFTTQLSNNSPSTSCYNNFVHKSRPPLCNNMSVSSSYHNGFISHSNSSNNHFFLPNSSNPSLAAVALLSSDESLKRQ